MQVNPDPSDFLCCAGGTLCVLVPAIPYSVSGLVAQSSRV